MAQVGTGLRAAVAAMLTVLAGAAGADGFDWRAAHRDTASREAARALWEAGAPSGEAAAHYRFALACLTFHAVDQAEAALDRVAQDPEAERAAAWVRAEILRRRHRLAESRAALEAILAEEPPFYPARMSLAYVRFLGGDFAGAVQDAMAVLEVRGEVDPLNIVRAHLVVTGASGFLAHYGGLVAKAVHGTRVLTHLRAAESLAPELPEVRFARGCYYLLAPRLAGRDLTRALDYLGRAVEGDPENAEFVVRLAQAHRALGDEAKYEALLSRARELDPGNELLLDIESGRCLFICVPKP